LLRLLNYLREKKNNSAMEERHSQAEEEKLISDPVELAAAEAQNALRQFDAGMQMLKDWLGDTQNPRIKPSQLLKLNGILLQDIEKSPGTYRAVEMHIIQSKHKPPKAAQVPELVEDMCEFLVANWSAKSAIFLSSYVLWQINWIHPFVDGNGRTARIFSYIILCAKVGYVLPGTKTIPEFISENKTPYYLGLESADGWFVQGKINVSDLELLLSEHLASQLLSAHDEARGVINSVVDDG